MTRKFAVVVIFDALLFGEESSISGTFTCPIGHCSLAYYVELVEQTVL
jgi:hypothetical protein